MAQFFKNLGGDSKGFTLVELLVVIALMAAMTTVVVPNFIGLIATGKTEAAAT